MNPNPQIENGHFPIANEIAEALSRTNLSPYESRVMWCILRKTYGWQKKEDWIALSQIVAMTGMHKAHASRAKAKLIARRIVTKSGNKIAFNKIYSQWRELPKQVTSKVSQTIVTSSGNLPPAYSGNRGVPVEAPQKTTYTKDTITKERPKEKMSDDELRTAFNRTVIMYQWCDDAYAEKCWRQGMGLRDRTEFVRKVRLMLAWAAASTQRGRAKTLFHEIAGFVNDSLMAEQAGR